MSLNKFLAGVQKATAAGVSLNQIKAGAVDMSLWTSIRNTVTGAVKGFVGSGGSLLGAAAGAITQGQSTPFAAPVAMSALPSIIPAAARALPKIPSLPGVGQVARTAATAVGAEMVWDAVSGMWRPKRKRRRAKGITAAQLRGFKRVAKILHDYQKVATKHHVKAPTRRR